MKNIQTETIVLLTLSFFIIFIIDKFKHKISKITNLVDHPDSNRKFHSKATPLLGGIMIFSSFLLINLYLIFFQTLSKTSLIIFLGCASCLALGLIDDIKRISYKYKFLILIIIFYLSISLDVNLQINKIYLATFHKEFYFNYLSIPFTVLCILLLTNAINLIDGMDGLCILISTIFIIWIMNDFYNTEPLYIVLIASLFYILYLNLKKNIFLGDSGSLFLGCLIGLNVILNYNLEISKNYYAVENIFITLMLPGLDMLRVFIVRIINKKNPFSPDRMHLHHLLIAQGLNNTNILTVFVLLVLLPILINLFTNINSIYIIVFYILFYIVLIFKLKKSIS
jgi:UDP-GlcNAc:undecaprenyl-phosphate/decaprenyl-phosphate GlcNAc-1-phosphate transferase